MAAENIKRIESQQEEWGRAHRIHDAVLCLVVPPYGDDPTLYFERRVDVECAVTPTSWTFRVTFVRHICGDVSCVIALRRTDDVPGSVDVTFSLIARDTYTRQGDYSVKFVVPGMPPGIAERRSFLQLLPLETAVKLLRIPLEIHIFLDVFDCHH